MVRGLVQAGLVLGFMGALLVAEGALQVLRATAQRRGSSRTRERQATAVGAVLLALGFLAQLAGMLTVGH